MGFRRSINHGLINQFVIKCDFCGLVSRTPDSFIDHEGPRSEFVVFV